MNIQFKQRGIIWLEQIYQDIRFSLRMLRKNPVFTAIAVISLALAIGVNSGIFSIVNGVLLRPLIPLRPNEVVRVYTSDTAADPVYRNFSFSEFSLLRESHEVFADVSAFKERMVTVGATANAEMRATEGYIVSDNYFSMLGVTPAMGRFFLPEESKPNANIPVAVVSRSLWETMGGGKDFSERTMVINDEIYAIVGVAPKGFSGTTALVAPDVWLPIGMADSLVKSFILIQGSTVPNPNILNVMARLKPGLKLKAAKARLPVLAERLTTIAVDAAEGDRALEIGPLSRVENSLHPGYSSHVNKQVNLLSALLIGMAGVVLLVACLNLANMFLARNTTRSDELAVRLALGAPRRRVGRILSVEGFIIALTGGGAGLVLSYWANWFLRGSLARWLSSQGISVSLMDITPDIRVLLATLLFCTVATLIFAVMPARHTIRGIERGNLTFQRSTRTTTDRVGRLFSGRNCLLMAQLALSLVLLFSAGLFLRAAYNATRLDLGFEPEGDLVAEIGYPIEDRDEASIQTLIAVLEEELRALPDVRKVALASNLPFGNIMMRIPVTTAGATGKQEHTVMGMGTSISSGYFDTLGINLLRGRDFTDQECLQAEGPSVVIIDQGMADTLFPGEDPVGRYIQNALPTLPGLEAGEARTSEPMQIVGVVSAHRNDVTEDSPPLRLFFPLAKESPSHIFVHMRGQTTEAATSGAFRELVRSKLLSLDPDIPLQRLTPYTDILESNETIWMLRLGAVLPGLFGAFALLLAVIGVYGVKSFVVARRMCEIGIRMALGASSRRIYALLMKQSAVLIAICLCVGAMLSLALGRVLAYMNLLVGVSPADPLVLVLAALVLSLASLLATWIPARRAAKVDPMEVLRWE